MDFFWFTNTVSRLPELAIMGIPVEVTQAYNIFNTNLTWKGRTAVNMNISKSNLSHILVTSQQLLTLSQAPSFAA